MFVAILGTTITPYVFYWQASQEAEEDIDKGKIQEISEDVPDLSDSTVIAKDVDNKPKISKKEVKMIRIDTAIGIHR